METYGMDHSQANDSQAAARYLLKEMRKEEFSAFEEHYIGCRECYDQVQFGFAVTEAMDEIFATRRQEKPGFLARVMAGLRRPVLAFSVAALVLAGIVVRQQMTFNRLTAAALVQTPTLRPVVKGSNDNVVIMPQAGIFTLNFLVDANPSEYVSYQTVLAPETQSGSVGSSKGKPESKSFAITAEEARNTVGIRLYSGDMAEGSYVLTTFGIKKEGKKVELASYSVALRFSR